VNQSKEVLPGGVLGGKDSSFWVRLLEVLIRLSNGPVAAETTNVDWFRFWLKGEQDPDPGKVDQYVRWRGSE